MNKLIIGALVGALILFIWQFLSWSMLNIHASNFQHSADQDKVLAAMEGLEEGSYFLPTVPEGTSQEDRETFMEGRVGKPWAMVNYHKSLEFSMGMNMIRGFVADFIGLLLLCWLLLKIQPRDFKTGLLGALAVGLIGYLTIHYINATWFETNSIPDLIDSVVGWGLVGLWLGFYLSD